MEELNKTGTLSDGTKGNAVRLNGIEMTLMAVGAALFTLENEKVLTHEQGLATLDRVIEYHKAMITGKGVPGVLEFITPEVKAAELEPTTNEVLI